MRPRWLPALAPLALACACTSAPVRFYTLQPPLAPAERRGSPVCCDVQIRVSIPAEVDRPELVRRSGDVQADILSNDTWLAPLRDEIRGALGAQIERQLSQPAVGPYPTRQKFVVQADIRRFESVPGREVLVSAEWRIRRSGDPHIVLRCATLAHYPAGLQVSSSVQGYRQAVSDIADRIAQGIRQDLQGESSLACAAD